jgi:hypothetical protein
MRMSGCGYTWYAKKSKAIAFEPETDKDLDRLEALLEELREAGFGDRIVDKQSDNTGWPMWYIKLEGG